MGVKFTPLRSVMRDFDLYEFEAPIASAIIGWRERQ
jgi:hypothetical protein